MYSLHAAHLRLYVLNRLTPVSAREWRELMRSEKKSTLMRCANLNTHTNKQTNNKTNYGFNPNTGLQSYMYHMTVMWQ